MILQLNPPLPLMTARGPGLAHFLLDYGPERHLLWVIADDATGECWTVANPEVRFAKNITMGRNSPEDLSEKKTKVEYLTGHINPNMGKYLP